MSDWKAKRFWKAANYVSEAGGFAIQLDNRPLRTPAKTAVIVPTERMAKAIAAEWDAQEGQIDPLSMPMTRSANAALDKVTQQFDEVAELIAAYGDTDLLCYRATTPVSLIERQCASWDPLLDWAKTSFGVDMAVTLGIMPISQPPETSNRFRAEVDRFTPFELTGFHDLVSLSGSLVIGLAATRKHADPQELWDVSRIDEIWQEEQWGKDDEATELAEKKRRAFLHAYDFFHFCT